jgi:PAS domain S-box-containing protein
MKLSFKTLVPLLLLLGAAFTAGLVSFYSLTRERLMDEAVLRQMLRAKEIAYQLKPGIAYSEQVAQATAAVVAPVRDEAELARLVQALLVSAPSEAIHGLGVWFEPSTFPDGKAPPAPYAYRSASDPRSISITLQGRAGEGEPHQQPWYQAGKAGRGGPVFLEDVPLGNDVYRLHTRAFSDATGKVAGVVAVDVSLPAIHHIIRQANASPEEVFFITTPTGHLFSHPEAERLLEWARKQGRAVVGVGELTLSDARQYRVEQDPSARRPAEVEVGQSGWVVHVSSAESALFANVRHFRLAVLLLGVAFWTVLLAIPFIFQRTLRVRELSYALEQRRRLHTMLERNERRLRDVLETTLDAVVAVDGQGRITEWNAQAERIFGWKREEVLGRQASETLLEPEPVGNDIALRQLVVEREASLLHQRLRTSARRRNGVLFPVELSATGVTSSDGLVYYLFLADITERQRAEAERVCLLKQLQQRGAELRGIIDTMVDSVVVSDVEGRVTFVNKAGRQFFGDVGEEGIQLTAEQFAQHGIRTSKGRLVRLEEMPLQRALRGNVVVDSDLCLPSPERRRTLYLRTNAAPIRDEQGRITGAVAVVRDVSEMVELDHLKDEFVKVAAHELKTPVAIMKSYAQLALKSEPTPATYRKMLDAINRGADRIDRIVRELLDVSQLHLGQLQLAEESLDLRELAEETVSNMAAVSGQHHFSVEAGAPVIVRGDRARLRQVLVVLLDNAVRYSPRGGRVQVRLAPGETQVEVCVSDEGIGIPAERQARLFERFYRAHSGTPHDRGGMGVGLYISREIIFHHGGTMRVSSEEGKGSTFCFSVPYTPEREQPGGHP